ncbi:MAG: cobyric acid synthase [Thermodesulfobacteriota bacterium]
MAQFTHGGHLGDLARKAGVSPSQIIDFSANINPLGPPPWLRSVVSAALASVVHYPDPECAELVAAVGRRYSAPAEEVLVGNGSTEILYLLPRVAGKCRAVVPVPSYSDYVTASRHAGLNVEHVLLPESEGFRLDCRALRQQLRGDELVFLGQPNNPTGKLVDGAELRSLAEEHPETLFVVDEAFADFVDGMPTLTENRPKNVAVLLSLTKIYAIPGLRLGCALADAGLVAKVRALQPPWSVNTVAQAVGEAALPDEDYRERSRAYLRACRDKLIEDLRSIPGLKVYPGAANFLLVKVERQDADAVTLAQRTLSNRIAIRVCENFDGLDRRFCRVAVRNERENSLLVDALKRALGVAARKRDRPRTRAIMFQGTSSNAGKSVMTAALCRILLEDGYDVAPFKAQNMSLNSFVTLDGGEMGRAQVFQAQACRLEPDVRMNPILLKPNSDTGSQVIVRGKPVGNMDVEEYVRYKPAAFDSAKQAYDELAARHDVIVLEGAGSPAEVNLKHHDIVNMRMAEYARAPVILVGDIDRGGVFASFVGTMEVLEEWERAMIAGFLVNRFRGQESLLRDAFDFVRRHTGVCVLGVVPNLENLGLPEEDSVTFKQLVSRKPDGARIEIAVVDLPHISNFTDFDALRLEPDVFVRVVRTIDDLNQPDAIVIPGSKNVPGDLEHLRGSGIADRITALSRQGWSEVVGICGGYQMIGTTIEDPHRIESDGTPVAGLNLLDACTVMGRDKTLTRVRGRHVASDLDVSGYEIHHGQTRFSNLAHAVIRDDGEVIGVSSSDGMAWGTYLHGVFDSDRFRRWFIDRLRTRRGMPPLGEAATKYDLEPAFERLARTVRSHVDMPRIYSLLGLPGAPAE